MIERHLQTKAKNFGCINIPEQSIGNTRLNVFPFEQTKEYVELPEPYKMWEETLNEILMYIPLQEDATQHCITINSEFFTEDTYQRREGIHIDGNFCVDPNYLDEKSNPLSTWGGMTWGGMKHNSNHQTEQEDNSHVDMDWVLPYNIIVPIGTYVDNNKGGLFIASSNIGTRYWKVNENISIAEAGDLSHMKGKRLKLSNSKHLPANELVFINSTTPHETLLIPKGTRRTFLRLTLNHNYDNRQIIS
jgi:hypothetical protein